MRLRAFVLCYHGISDIWRHPLALPARAFERQIRSMLSRRYRPVTAAQALSGAERGFHVTFDDAFRTISLVLPGLERLRVPVTVFACPAYADDGRALAIPELAAEAAAYPSELETMDWAMLRELGARGVEIGSHTLTHPHLTQLADEKLRSELVESRRRLEEQLQRPCRFLSYPYGEHDARVRAAAAAAGYDAAFDLPGRWKPFDPLAVPRVGVYQKDRLWRFRVKTSPVHGVAAAVRRRLAG